MGLISSKLETIFVLGVKKRIFKKKIENYSSRIIYKYFMKLSMLRVPKLLLVCFSMHCKTETAFGC